MHAEARCWYHCDLPKSVEIQVQNSKNGTLKICLVPLCIFFWFIPPSTSCVKGNMMIKFAQKQRQSQAKIDELHLRLAHQRQQIIVTLVTIAAGLSAKLQRGKWREKRKAPRTLYCENRSGWRNNLSMHIKFIMHIRIQVDFPLSYIYLNNWVMIFYSTVKRLAVAEIELTTTFKRLLHKKLALAERKELCGTYTELTCK